MDLKLVLEFTQKLEILYVEDNKALRENTQLLFSNLFAKVDVAEDGKHGVAVYQQYFEDNQKYYDLVVTDINMPHMNGLEMSREIYNLNDEQAIIIITAHNEIEYLLEAIDMGVSSFLLKPLDMKKMAKVFYKVCQHVYDHKFVLTYYNEMEDINLKLLNENNKLKDRVKELEEISEPKVIQLKSESIKAVENKSNECFMNQIADLVSSDLAELVELNSEMDKVLVNILMGSFDRADLDKNLSLLSVYFDQYSSVLSFYTFFDDLSKNMATFSKTLNIESLVNDKEQYLNIFTLLESFLFVLKSWQNELATCDHSKIDYYNSSIINDMTTIGNMWSMETIKEEEAEIEFF